MQKSKIEKIFIFNSFDIKLKFLTSWVELTQFSVELSCIKLKIWAIRLESSWKCEQFNSISIQVQNVNLKLNSMISLISICIYTEIMQSLTMHCWRSYAWEKLTSINFYIRDEYLMLLQQRASATEIKSLTVCKVNKILKFS